MAYEVRGGLEPEYADEHNDNDDEAVSDEELDDEEDGGEARFGRSWSKTMTIGMGGMGMGMGSWKGTKKLLTGKSPAKREVVKVGLIGGAPLTKSVSTTTAFIGA